MTNENHFQRLRGRDLCLQTIIRTDWLYQCLKWRLPVKTIEMPCLSAQATTSSSFLDPPGCTTAVMPAAAAFSTLSGNGKNASEAITDPLPGRLPVLSQSGLIAHGSSGLLLRDDFAVFYEYYGIALCVFGCKPGDTEVG